MNKIKSRFELQKIDGGNGVYQWLRKNRPDILDSFLPPVKIEGRSFEECQKSALKYTQKIDWYKKERKIYNFAYTKGWMDQLTTHMEHSKVWSVEEIRKEAAKYTNESAFRKQSSRVYFAAVKKKIKDDVCSHMDRKNTWTFEVLKKRASIYSHKVDFYKEDRKAYVACVKRGIINEVCAHMTQKQKTWDLKTLTAEALKYKTRGDFHSSAGGAWAAAKRLGVTDKICKHMDKYVKCIENGKIYKDQREAAKDLDIHYSKISCVLRGLLKNAKGYSFVYCDKNGKDINNV